MCDNTYVITLSHNPILYLRIKHIELDYHYVRKKVFMNQLTIQFIPSFDQKTNILTKKLPKA